MSEPYTPDTETVREQYTREQPPHTGTVSSKCAEFDRWLAGVKADARREGQVGEMRQAAYVAGDVAPDGMGGNDWFPSEWSDYVAAWLEYRADRIENGDDQ